jgi:GNAT superfamily N-acetyltransferase
MNRPPLLTAQLGPDYPQWDATLGNGATVLIRPIGPDDAPAERAFIESLSAKTRRNRFLGELRHPSDAFIRQLTDIDYVRDVALVATVPEDSGYRIVGVSRYAVDASGATAECAVVVADAWQRLGLGTALMDCLKAVAHDHGLRRLQSVDFAQNQEMHDLALAFGFHSAPDPGDPHQLIYTLELKEPAVKAPHLVRRRTPAGKQVS